MIAPSLALILYRPDVMPMFEGRPALELVGSAAAHPSQAQLAAVKTYHLTTFGCQMNEHDSERTKGMLSRSIQEAGSAAAPT